MIPPQYVKLYVQRRKSHAVHAEGICEAAILRARGVISEVARRQEISRQQLSAWRRAAGDGLLKLPKARPGILVYPYTKHALWPQLRRTLARRQRVRAAPPAWPDRRSPRRAPCRRARQGTSAASAWKPFHWHHYSSKGSRPLLRAACAFTSKPAAVTSTPFDST
ncbi:transposase [Bradyrhizobium sp. 183]|uniref:transposase n=1 Tax=Bradyrhizobium sp. 184 TaxID=2782653 RepID=UPI00204B451F|nr:transposase [Bradyrhizobium sp. 184]UPJ87061.1 transposase [Bradyrhizobium sp. 183]